MRGVYINGWGSISSLGGTQEYIRESYRLNRCVVDRMEVGNEVLPVYRVPSDVSLPTFKNPSLQKNVDRVHQLALHGAKNALAECGWHGEAAIPVIIGSARGATATLERAVTDFNNSNGLKLAPYTSPITTAGNIAALISKEFSLGAPISASMTCASALESLLSGYALLKGDLAEKCLVGGAEAPLTPFGLAQMQALRIYSQEKGEFPCKPCAHDKVSRSALALGEAAALFGLSTQKPDDKGVEIASIVAMVEDEASPTGMDANGAGFYKSMRRALQIAGISKIDAIIVHAPGTALGDTSELGAIQNLFNQSIPPIFSTKYLTGHTFGASAALSIELAMLLLDGLPAPAIPYPVTYSSPAVGSFKTILINCAGFGGVVGSIIMRK